YVPLEKGQPRWRVEYMVKDGGVEWVLVDKEGLEEWEMGGVDVVEMEGAGREEGWLAGWSEGREGRGGREGRERREEKEKARGEGEEGGGRGGKLFKVTPAHLEALEYVGEGEEGRGEKRAGRGKHVVVVGGEQLGAERLRRWKKELLPEARFVNEYGPTEAVVGCSVWEMGGVSGKGVEEWEGEVVVTIGRAM